LQHGLRKIREQFPTAAVSIYAVQEPCWASCLPQLLVSLGFKGASLKNASTAWGGYSSGFDAELVNWIGSDQTSIVTVPRYACEQLVNTWETEAVAASPEYVVKCVEHGITKPVGMCFQDLGWAARPRVTGDHVRHVTWQEYLLDIGHGPGKDWNFTLEDIRTTLPWGEKTLQKVAQQSRSAEVRLLMAEKMAAMASVHGGLQWPTDALGRAWEQVLWSQFHDCWITATTRSGREAWAFQVAAQTLEAEETAEILLQQAGGALSKGEDHSRSHPLGAQHLRVFNTLGHEREDLVECTLAFDHHAEDFRIVDERGVDHPLQWTALRRYEQVESGSPDEKSTMQTASLEINAARLLFKARVPAVGFNTYSVIPLRDGRPPKADGLVKAYLGHDGMTVVENELYSIVLDPKRGGAIVSLVQKEVSRQLCPVGGEFLFNEYRGYFIAQARWISSTEHPATITVIEPGPVRATVRIDGEIGGCPARTMITLVAGERRIGFDVTFEFQQETWIGEPWDILPKDRMTEQHRGSHDGRWKLQALFPTRFQQKTVDKNGAFDVCRSRNINTYFQRWDEIKHNIILNWVDVRDDSQDAGLALFSEHTTAYTHGPDHPLALVLGWGGEGGFWWGKCSLLGEQRARYTLMPHRGGWQQAQLWEELAKQEEPFFASPVDGGSIVGEANRSLLNVSDPGVQLTAMASAGSDLEVRLFNAQTTESHCTATWNVKMSRAEMVELDGRVRSQLAVRRLPDGQMAVDLAMPPFAIRTLRFSS
jgi:alpha-mannosidase